MNIPFWPHFCCVASWGGHRNDFQPPVHLSISLFLYHIFRFLHICWQINWKEWHRIWHADVSRWITLCQHGCWWLLLSFLPFVHPSNCLWAWVWVLQINRMEEMVYILAWWWWWGVGGGRSIFVFFSEIPQPKLYCSSEVLSQGYKKIMFWDIIMDYFGKISLTKGIFGLKSLKIA